MATINFATREITAKVVYFGASKAGTTTTVQQLHQQLPGVEVSRLHNFGPAADEQILYFEYIPGELPRFGGFALRVQVYALPGSVRRRVHREEVLGGTDAVVFVADARRSRAQANVDALVQLEDALDRLQFDLARMPAVILVNHVDHDEARAEAEVGLDLNTYGFPILSSVARDGRGVVEAQTATIDRVSLQLRANLAGEASGLRLEAVHDPDAERDDEVVQRHIAAIAQRASEIDADRPGWDDLFTTLTLALPFRAPELEGLRPLHLLDHTLEGDNVVLDLVFEDANGEPTRGAILLDRRMRHRTELTVTDSVGQYLPDSDAPNDRDLEPWQYGMIGVVGGAVVTLLVSYIAGLFG